MNEQRTLRQLRTEILRHKFERQEREKKLKAKRLRTWLVQQMTQTHNLDFIVYYLTEEQLDLGDGKSPIVTVVTAWDKDGGTCDNKYMRGVAICSRKDAPNRLDGFNMAARRLLRTDKDGLAPIHLDPDNEHLWDVWYKLINRGLVACVYVDDVMQTYACSHSSDPTPLEICVLEGRMQRREDRKKRHEKRDKFFLIVKQSEGLHSKGDE